MINKTENKYIIGNYFNNYFKKHTLNVSTKNIFTVESNSATATNLLFGLIFTQSTLSSNFNVLVCSNDRTLALLSLDSSVINSKFQNLTVLSPPPVTQPLISGCKQIDHNSVECAGISSNISPAPISIIKSFPSFKPAKICLSPGTKHKDNTYPV